MKKQNTLWLTNISPYNVSLTDLNLTIKAYSSVNLLDSKHYKYTIEQLKKSIESGSVFAKRNKIVVRKVAPEVVKSNILINKESVIPTREKSIFEIKQEEYEELNMTDDMFGFEDETPAKKG